MTARLAHVEARELLALHALGGLDADDRAALDAHLDGCAACAAELAGLRETAAELARAATPMTPSREVTERILAAPSPAAPRVSAPARVGGRHRERRGRRIARWVVGLGVAVVLVTLVASHLELRRRLGRASSVIASGRALLEFMAEPDVDLVRLSGGARLPDAHALVALQRGSGRIVFLGFGLPSPPEGRVYQLWAISDAPRPAAVLAIDGPGPAMLNGTWASGGGATPLFGVTLEPAPGREDPSGPMILLSRPGPAGG